MELTTRPESGTQMRPTQLDQRIDTGATTVLASAWPHLSAIAGRLADGTRADSERIIRDAWRRWSVDADSTRSGLPGRFANAGDRIAVEIIAAAHRRTEHPARERAGRTAEPGAGSASETERTQAAELAVLVLRAQLTPAAQLVFVARKAFACPAGGLRRILRSGAIALGDPGRPARTRRDDWPRRRARPMGFRPIARAFRAAARSANLADIEDLLGADLVDRPALWRRLSRPAPATRSIP
ncbi:hypothetical protein [Jiangella anatolica]|uniref:Uncharacterized protein n=1 Tax=Jiangella anatolica TaxID=2670374 RepID=A0A2W2CWU5_9ACTN|nr:hypothetical protein [Jiangella anatolica]PZF84683.1 hypothetical protein C1I92_07400 [Jiangella anatolica]